jgi:hypothetical protein
MYYLKIDPNNDYGSPNEALLHKLSLPRLTNEPLYDPVLKRPSKPIQGQYGDWVLNLQREVEHLREHKDRDCYTKGFCCYPDHTKMICPQCLSQKFVVQQSTDENDTYIWIKCPTCGLTHEITH